MTTEHKASYATGKFDVMGNLQTHLDNKRDVLRGQRAEIARIEKSMVECSDQIEELERAIAILLKAAD